MCDLNNAGPGMPWIPQSMLALDRNHRGLEIGRGAQGEGPLLVATPWSPSLLILEPGMPQTGRHLPKSSRKEGTGLLPCRVHCITCPTRHGPAGLQVGWGSACRGGGGHLLWSPVPVLNSSPLEASPCVSRPFLSSCLK